MKIKKWLKIFVGFVFVFLVSSCTANFCTNRDKASMWYSYYSNEANFTKLIDTAKKTIDVPHQDFWDGIDAKTKEAAIVQAEAENFADINDEEKLLKYYGYVMFLDDETSITQPNSNKRTLWANWDKWVVELSNELGPSKCPNGDFNKYFKKAMNDYTLNKTWCLTPIEGDYGPDGVHIEGKTWGDAWNEGLFEGLLVYPISWMVDALSRAFGMNGWGQLAAITVVTIIIRGLMLAATFKTTMATQKMTALQPELAKIQAKYPNANTNQYDKQRLAQEQMALYKKNKINPFGQILVMFLQFPVFICVWGALQGAAILSTDSVLGLDLSASLGREMFNFSTTACITAIALFIIMSAAQIVSMKLPQWLAKKKTKAGTKLGKNPAADAQNKQMKLMNNIMLIMIIFMGFSLPAAMAVYWLIGAIISIVQTIITQKVMEKKK